MFAKSPALLAGLKAGDLITAIENETLSQRTTMEVSNMLAIAPDKVTITYQRNGKLQKAILQKDFAYKYDKSCLSGDCINGNGVAISNWQSGILMEGKFSEGQLVEGSWYYNAKSLQEKGVLFRKGKVVMNRYFSGATYDPEKPDGGWWYQVTNHDVVRSFNIVEKNLHGYVKCYSNKTLKYLWEGEFENGKRSGDFGEYLYDKGFYWSYYESGGEKLGHRLKKLTGDKVGHVWLNEDVLHYNENSKTWSGWFLASLVNRSLSDMTKLENVSSYNDIEAKALANNSSPATTNNNNNGKVTVKPTVVQSKDCGYCNGRGATYTYTCSDCDNTGFTNYKVGTNSYNAVRQVCTCVGGGMMGWNYIKTTLENRKKICSYCRGTGLAK